MRLRQKLDPADYSTTDWMEETIQFLDASATAPPLPAMRRASTKQDRVEQVTGSRQKLTTAAQF